MLPVRASQYGDRGRRALLSEWQPRVGWRARAIQQGLSIGYSEPHCHADSTGVHGDDAVAGWPQQRGQQLIRRPDATRSGEG